ncbi:polysaccharide lyase family 8 super-sandwich domain-containing protein [uncultured Parabacteroides sp.]|uniref:polysaccharide lyase family 8 super-sandwich domain-containing protein n=1 Tax=uncultured Parabacteroides sp. TaxID=512312 RepID=UPI0025E84005|nr:polysaccharide lyase family 8 super-sandwich domain-containing protein [uncultured Parabacteroides sp.]
MKLFTNTLLLSLLLFLPVNMFSQTPGEELEHIRQNYIQSLIDSNNDSDLLNRILAGIPPETEMSDQVVIELHQRYPFNMEEIKGYMEQINEDGSWPDINYADTKRSGWDAKKHADRVLELAKLYHAEGPSCTWSPRFSTVIHQALDYWFRTKPVCKNWWYNEIGIPKTFGPAFILLRTQMTPAEQKEAVKVMDNARFGMTGQNKVWLAGNVLMKGLLLDDYELVKAARDTIVSEITTGREEGIKGDWSFHQHGPQQQFGNYGLAYLSEMSFYSGLFAGTSLALNAEQQSILNNLLTEGYRWIIWRGYMDVNALDRQLFHNAPIHKALAMGNAANSLRKGSSPADAGKLQAFLDDNFPPQQPRGTAFTGQKHFWDSDQTIHRAPKWMASIKMASERVIGTELVNEDNLKGFYMGDGATYVYRGGDEYMNVFPFWDWRKIPGITSYESDAPVPSPRSYGAHTRNETAFVGGVTDGRTGMTAMILNRDGLNARKSWVITDDFMLCLGAGIQSDSTLNITTSIDQRKKRGDLSYFESNRWNPVNGTFTANGKALRFFHDSIGYILMQPENCVAISEKRSGRWSDFMGSYTPQTVEGEVISLYIGHRKQAPASYQYLILPASTAERTASFRTEDIRILRNDASMQAVAIPGSYYITAYEEGTIRLAADLSLEIKTPGIYKIEEKDGNLRVDAADPTHTQSSLSVKINDYDLKIIVPSDHAPGQSVTVTPIITAPQVGHITVDGKKDDWKIAPAVTGLIAPWDGAVKDHTSFSVCHDKKNLYFMYEVSDSTIIYNDEKTEASVGNSDRIEFFISKDPAMADYYCAEIDPQGKVMDYHAQFYRKFDFSWNFKGLKLGTHIGLDSYIVEGSIPLKSLEEMGVISPKGEILFGIYRADYYDQQEDQVIWSPWIIPDVANPDFHIPSSLGVLKLK